MYFNVASTFYNNFLKLLRHFSSRNICLLYSTFSKLLERFIEVLAEILYLEIMHVPSKSSSSLKSKSVAISFTVILLLNNFSCVVTSKQHQFSVRHVGISRRELPLKIHEIRFIREMFREIRQQAVKSDYRPMRKRLFRYNAQILFLFRIIYAPLCCWNYVRYIFQCDAGW